MRATASAAVVAGLAIWLAYPSSTLAAGAGLRVLGFGTQSCGSWTANRHSTALVSQMTEVATLGWVEGYLTAFQQALPRISPAIHESDSAGIEAWVDNYCGEHPLDSIAKAAEALVIDFGIRSQKPR